MTRARKLRAVERMELLEDRLYWSVSLDANGWTVVTPDAASKVIYVSSSTGSDSNPGTIGAPVATLHQAQIMSVSGDNEILLKDGDVFNNPGTSSSNVFNGWSLSGQSAAAPFFVGSYGSGARPLVNSGQNGVAFGTGTYGTSGAVVNYLDVIGIQFDANLRDTSLGTVSTSPLPVGGNKGFEFYANGGNVLVEDCSFNYYGYNFDVEALPGSGSSPYQSPSITNFEIRRSVVSNSYAFNGGRSQGLYAFDVNGLSIQQCDFDHDGWNAQQPSLDATDIGYNHDMYIASTCLNVDVENCIVAEASYAGIMARAGGIIDNNLFIDDTVACSYGDADGADSAIGGVTGTLIGNTIVGDKAEYSTTSSPLAFGQGFVIANISPTGSCVVSGNLFTADTQNAKPAIQLTMATGSTNASQEVGLNNVTLTGNIVNGWRYGLQTDGRFVAGGSGEFGLNNLKISKNDFVDSSTELVRHDGTFATTQESWSGDRYYDPTSTLAQSKWITLTGNNLPFATWVSNYDIGATALSVLPYSAPTRTVATYDTTVGGVGTFQDYLKNAALLSITNYQTQYMATAAASYVEAGFNIIAGSGGISNSAPTTALATTTDVNTSSLGATSYAFTVNFTGGSPIKALASGNLLVTGPNGFSQLAAYNLGSAVTTTDTAGYQHTAAIYKITPPSGTWATGKKQDGTYTISMLANQVADLNGNFVADGVMGTFTVDLTPPTATVIAPAVGSAGAGNTSYAFSITYSDASGIDPTTLYSGEVQVTGPNGYSQYATPGPTTTSNNGTVVVANYTITPPGGMWVASANGTYSISMAANLVSDLSGNAVTAGTLGTFAVQVSGASTVGTGSIAGVVFNDANGDGLLSTRELPLVGVTMFIDLAGTGVYAAGDPTAVTDGTGTYTFTGLAAGRYTIGETAPAGYGVTTPSTGENNVTLTTGQVATGVNFANQIGASVISSLPSNGSTGTTTTSGSGSSTKKPFTPPPVLKGKNTLL